jgi:threonine synthase
MAIGGEGMLLGNYFGFKQLRMRVEISRIPQIYGVQAETCDPV